MGWEEDAKKLIEEEKKNPPQSDPVKDIVEEPFIQSLLNTFEGPGTKIERVGILEEDKKRSIDINNTSLNKPINTIQKEKDVFTYAEICVQKVQKEALAKNWTKKDLWQREGWYDQQGLVCFIDEDTQIGEITEKYIELNKKLPSGEIITTRFYNQKKLWPTSE